MGPATIHGRGRCPSTESTAILSGMGANSANGAASSDTRNVSARRARYGRTNDQTRHNTWVDHQTSQLSRRVSASSAAPVATEQSR